MVGWTAWVSLGGGTALHSCCTSVMSFFLFEGLRKDLGLGPELRAVLRISNTNTVSLVFIQIAPAGESQTTWRNGDQELTFVIAVLSLSVKR